ncbi:MAG: hypothetical protein HZB95_00875 [Nitrosomonadales bacterium]|nr:hypothetical protein [Nitrosomonadales bacterium]
MKKIVLSMAGVLAATAFAPEASAIPAFARQTGLACSSCHYQHYPVLSTTGQEFKVGAYTQLSAKGKFKGEDLSIPDQLNAAILLKARYQKTNGTDAAGTVSGTTTNSGQWQIPDELSLFFGGRIGDNGTVKMGFMNENNMAAAPMIAGLKVPVAIALDPVTIQVIPYGTDALGMAYGFEQSSTGMTRGVRWAEHRSDISAAQYTGIGSGAASGIAYVVNSDIGYINFSKFSREFFYIAGSTGTQMSSTWIRVAATPTIADWAMHIGVGKASGTSWLANGTSQIKTEGTVVDFQGQGAIAEMETSVYAQYATAPASTGAIANAFNSKTGTAKKAITVGADFSVIPHTLHIGAAYRIANTGVNAGSTAGDKDNSLTITAVYDLFQNVAVHVNHSMRSGSSYDTTGTNAAATAVNGSGKTLTTFMLEAAW